MSREDEREEGEDEDKEERSSRVENHTDIELLKELLYKKSEKDRRYERCK